MPDPINAGEVDPWTPASSEGDRPRSRDRHPLIRTMWRTLAVGIPAVVVVGWVLIASGVDHPDLVARIWVVIGVLGLVAWVAALLGRFTQLGRAATVAAVVLASLALAAVIVVVSFISLAIGLALYYHG